MAKTALFLVCAAVLASLAAADDKNVFFTDGECALVLQTSENYYSQGETVRIETWGRDSLRVRSTYGNYEENLLHALNEPVKCEKAKISIKEDQSSAEIQNGNIRAVWDNSLRLAFFRVDDGTELIGEYQPPYAHGLPAREFQMLSDSISFSITARFASYEGERIYGLGQHMHGRLNQKGMNIDLRQVNTEVSIPFYVSSRQYGFLWNNPSWGQAQFGMDRTQWTAQQARVLDYWVTTRSGPGADPYSDIMSNYADVTGHAPPLPEFAAGFWQCKLRYRNQTEVLEAARGYHERGLPISVIVVDYFHWPQFGDWKFTPKCFPDPKGMTEELARMGIKLMASFWPVVSDQSENYDEMRKRRLLVGSRAGDVTRGGQGEYLYDPFNPDSRKFVWGKVRENYYDNGVKVFWLDAAEPEWTVGSGRANHQKGRYFSGSDVEVGNIFPKANSQTMFDGLRSEGETEIISLSRSAWAGSQKYAAAMWSGDIDSTFEALEIQIAAGLNVMMSGMQWWTTDTGGFFNGDVTSPYFRELIVRWFQYSTFTPLMRLHGARTPNLPDNECGSSGGPNEIWHFGDEAYNAIVPLLELRTKLQSYIIEHMNLASTKGTPIMRPLFYAFPEDDEAARIEDQFMFGPDFLVAPIYKHKALSRDVYLPAGHNWRHFFSGKVYQGGKSYTIEGKLSEFPLFTLEKAVEKGVRGTFI